jgi:adenylate cyclase
MSKLLKSVILGFVVGLLGIVLSLTSFGHGLEENIGLGLLFNLRGERDAPSDVIVVNIDKASSDKLNLPNRPVEWPRALHARLIENLLRAGAAVIVFDVTFNKERDPVNDRIFAQAVRKARNVVFCEFLKKEVVPFGKLNGAPSGKLDIDELVPPIPILAKHAAALAPFPLPKLPFRVNQYWTFKTSTGDIPTLPVVAFQVYGFQVYNEFIELLKKYYPSKTDILSLHEDKLIDSGNVVKLMMTLRDIFQKNPAIADRMLAELKSSKTLASDRRKRKILTALIKMYQAPDSRYLNFYGPSGTITTVPYNQVLYLNNDIGTGLKKIDFRGKVIFIGQAETQPYLQKDGFYTVFTTADGLDLNGVEIAATAFANILEGLPVRPLSMPSLTVLLLICGLFLGVVAFLLPSIPAVITIIVMNALYLYFALYQFRTAGVWYPLVVPCLLQSPASFFGAVVWKYVDSGRERQKIRKAFSYYLPEDIVDKLIINIGDIGASTRIVNGTCLYTDLEQYTALSETMEPEELSKFVKQYYETIFGSVKRYGGVISNVVADSMLALWVSAMPDDQQRKNACLAALDLAEEVQMFNQSSPDVKISTRIGLNFGRFLLGNIGAIDHYEYRPIGDIVNTTARLEGLNKHLGTYLLVSAETIEGIRGILAREVGRFLLYGKAKPVKVFELICRADKMTEEQEELCLSFAEALDAFRNQLWEDAAEKFHDIINKYGKDGPSQYYLELIPHYREEPPGKSWDGLICVEKK